MWDEGLKLQQQFDKNCGHSEIANKRTDDRNFFSRTYVNTSEWNSNQWVGDALVPVVNDDKEFDFPTSFIGCVGGCIVWLTDVSCVHKSFEIG